jgi:hypothetical protein
MSAPTPVPVEVNLNVEISANGDLVMLSEQLFTVNNVVCATETIPAAALYEPGTRALIEFWEDNADIDTINAQLANTNIGGNNYTGYYKLSARELAKGLQKVLCGELDANKTGVTRAGESSAVNFAASPFASLSVDKGYGASGSIAAHHHKFPHFGRLALACYAHYIMGHQQATAAITNDKAFMKNMLSVTGASADAAVAVDYDGADATALSALCSKSFTADPIAEGWKTLSGSASDADLARRLVGKLLNANLDASNVPIVSTVDTANPAGATAGTVASIVDQVIGRDVSRARDDDNSKYTPEKHGLLKFFANDVIYVNIKLVAPTVSVGGNGSGQQVQASTLAGLYATEENYTIRIVLA